MPKVSTSVRTNEEHLVALSSSGRRRGRLAYRRSASALLPSTVRRLRSWLMRSRSSRGLLTTIRHSFPLLSMGSTEAIPW
jgi:hypothetical protein